MSEGAVLNTLDSKKDARLLATKNTIKRSKNGFWLLLGLSALLFVTAIISLMTGAVSITPLQVLAIAADRLGIELWWDYSVTQQTVLESIRVPRVILSIIVGAGLAISGAAMQGFFRNPLADPALIGISSGAALAAVTIIVLGASYFSGFMDQFGLYALPFAAFMGGLLATSIVYSFSKGSGKTNVATMLLVGIAINAIAGAGTGLLIYVADDAQLRILTFWSMGSLAGGSWENLAVVVPMMMIPIVLLPLYAGALNAILLGESEAMHLGFNLEVIKRNIIILVAFCVGVAVSVSGIIGFVGLVVPHMLRLLFGPDHRWLLPASALLGASLLLWADLLARTIVIPAELPIGIITAMIGGPFFLWILYKSKGRMG